MKYIATIILFSSIVFSQQSLRFDWVNPLPAGIDFRDAKVFSADTIYLVGDAGTFMKTSNGGTEWFRNANINGTSARVNALSFINKDTGWICTDSGRIFRTNNGGVTFTSQVSNIPYPLYDISFTDKDHGWVSADSGFIYRTENGGGKWSKVYTNYDVSLYSISFRDNDTGFVCGDKGYLYKSTDGGVTWGLRSAGTINPLRKISLQGDTIVIGGLNGTVVLSVNGGLSFSPTNPPVAGGTFYNISYAGNGYIYTGSNNGKGYRSTNLGNSWSQLLSTTNTLNWLFAADFVSPRVGVIAGRAGTILRPHPVNDSLVINDRITSETFRAVQNFSGSSNVYVTGLGGITFKSTNNGVTWNPLTLPSGITTMSAVCFTDPVKGVMTGANGKINYTTDGGKTWTGTTIGTARYWGLDIKGSIGFAGNSSGSIVRTTNGGATWGNYSSVGSKYIYSFDILNDSVAYLTTGLQENSIYRSTNFGYTWDQVFTTDIASLFSVRFANDSVGFAVGQMGQFYYTTDAGMNWTKVPSDSTVDYFCVDVTNYPQGIVSGTNGKLVGFTMNEGAPVLYTIPSGTQSSLYSVSASKKVVDGGYTIYAAGENGNILRYYQSSNAVPGKVLSPVEFILEQNYPNPFNPVTTINFTLHQQGAVTLTIHDLLGRQIATLADNVFSAGPHTIQWDAGSLANGVYFYTLKTPSSTVSKKAVLLK
jgi:photosystem II stability/assembly factor-like uncharacterized protein